MFLAFFQDKSTWCLQFFPFKKRKTKRICFYNQNCFWWYIFAILLITDNANAQDNYLFRTYTQEDGLATGTLRGIGHDSTGFIWLLSENGLSRFDGYAFKVFRHDAQDNHSISSSIVQSMSIDPTKRILFRTENAINEYTPSTHHFKPLYHFQKNEDDQYNIFIQTPGCWIFKSEEILLKNFDTGNTKRFPYPSGFTYTRNTSLLTFSNLFWMNHGDTLVNFNPETGQFSSFRICSPDTLNSRLNIKPLGYFTNKEKETCFISKAGLFKYNSATHCFQLYAKIKFPDSKDNPVKKVLTVNKKFLAVLMRFNSLYIVHIDTGNITEVDLKDSLCHGIQDIETFSMISSTPASVWISSSNSGVFGVDLAIGKVKEHLYNIPDKLNSLPSNNIEYMLETEGVLWLASPGLGLIKAQRNIVLLPSYRPGHENPSLKSSAITNIRALGELDNDNLLIGTLAGLFRFNKTSHLFSSVLSPLNGTAILKDEKISAIVRDSANNFWISNWGRHGITVFNKDQKFLQTLCPDDNPGNPEYQIIRSLFIDSRKNLWIGTDDNIIYRLSTQEFRKTNLPVFEKFRGKITGSDTLIFNMTSVFMETPKKQILIGTQNGLYVYDYVTGNFKRYFKSRNFSKDINEADVRCLYMDPGQNLWIGAHDGGLNKIDSGLTHILHFNRENGLPDNSIYSILGDGKGSLWMGTNRGICNYDPRSGYIRNFSLLDGLQNYEFNTNVALQTTNGELIFGGINGFNIFKADDVKTYSTVPKVVISEFKINNRDYPLSDHIILNYDENSLAFQFATLSYYRSRENQYAYQLTGVDNDWVYCSRRRYSNYAGLSPGTYTFQVKACNYNGMWNEKAVSVRFTIKPPFWGTWWFKTLVLAAITGLIYLLILFRLRQKLKLELLRNKIARDLHDEIGSNLNSIALFTAAAKERTLRQPGQLGPLLLKIGEYTQSSLESINDIVWMINSKNDMFENILIRMRKHAAEIFESSSIMLHLSLDENLNPVKINMDTRQNFYLIYKEALNNVIKYAACKNLWIELQLHGNFLILNIKDDGKGFDLETLTHSNGINNMQKRAELLAGSMLIHSLPGKGTTIHLEFPI